MPSVGFEPAIQAIESTYWNARPRVSADLIVFPLNKYDLSVK
jgi:hypothetical protein